MSYIVKIRNGLGLKQAELRLSAGEVVVVTGTNASGKSSLATLVGSVFCYDKNPLGFNATQKKVYLADDAMDGGEVTLQTDADGAEELLAYWDLASGEISQSAGRPVVASAASVGLVDFMARMGEKARSAIYESLLMPSTATLISKLRKSLHGVVRDETLEEVMGVVERDGLDAVQRTFVQRRKDAKANWQKRTNISDYSKKIAPTWRPSEWEADMDGMTLTEAEQLLAEAEQQVKVTAASEAISAHELGEALDAKARLPELEEAEAAAASELARAEAEFDEKRKTFEDDRQAHRVACTELAGHDRTKPGEADPLNCPGCGEELVLTSRGQLVKYDREGILKLTREWSEGREEYAAAVANAKAIVDLSEEAYDEANAAYKEKLEAHGNAEGELKSTRIKAEDADKEAEDAKLEAAKIDAQKAVKHAEKRIEMIRAVEDARREHEKVQQYDLVCAKLGSKGFRADAMEKAIDNVNNILAVVHERTGWGPVRVEKNTYVTTYGPHVAPSESEKWRAQVSLQIAMQVRKRDPVIIIDRADVLDKYAAQELARMIGKVVSWTTPDGKSKESPPPAVLICGTSSDEDAPPSWTEGLGRFTWHQTAANTLSEGMVVGAEA